MAAGDIIFNDGTILTPADLQKLLPEIITRLNSTAKDPGDYEEATSLQGISSIPTFFKSGNTYKLVRTPMTLLKGADGREVEMIVDASTKMLKYHHVGDTEWTDLYDLSTFQGESAYQLWQKQEGNAGKTEAEYIAFLKQPATEAGAAVTDQMAQITENAEQAISGADNAKEAATTAAQNAAEKALLADTAAMSANEKATLAEQKAALAVTAATAANNAAASVDTATAAAENAAINANDKATLAANAAALANEKATLANAAASVATEQAIIADAAATRANNAAEAAEGALQGVRPDWNEPNTASPNYIANKPTSMPASDVSQWAKAATKPTYTASEVGALSSTTVIPEQVNSDWNATDGKAKILNKPTSMPASDVSDWAKAASKPTYTATEVGAAASGHTHSQYLTEHQDISGKVDKVAGKGLSTNDYDNTAKGVLDKFTGVNKVNTLTLLPVTRRSIVATLSAATNISLLVDMAIGEELIIRCIPTANFTQPIPTTGSWSSLSGSSFDATSGTIFEISIWCYDYQLYSIVIKEAE